MHLILKSLLFYFILISFSAQGQERPFTATFNTDSYNEISLKTKPEYNYSYDVDWNNDGTFDDLGVTSDIIHIFDDGKENHTISIRGIFPHFRGYEVIDIIQWGDIKWKSFELTFRGGKLKKTLTATDSPDLSETTTMRNMFSQVEDMDTDISSWDVSNVTDMSYMFEGVNQLNSNISTWDVSSVTDMSHMFEGVNQLNSNISSWDVSNVTDMSHMFKGIGQTTIDISGWDVSNVTTMAYMFRFCSDFNPDLSNWDVSNVLDMFGTFSYCVKFDGDIANWNTSNVTNMSEMFNGTRQFNGDLSNWNVSNVTDMSYMFNDCTVFNSVISDWNTSSVEDMSYMFYFCKTFNQDISKWDVSKVSDMACTFEEAMRFNSDISGWNVSAVESFRSTFRKASNFNSDISSWAVGASDNFDYAFYMANSFNCDVSDWEVSTKNMRFMFSHIDSEIYNNILIKWSQLYGIDQPFFGAGDSKYTSNEAKDIRHDLVYNKNWRITDGGYSSEEIPFIATYESNGKTLTIDIPNYWGAGHYCLYIDWDNDGEIDDFNITESITHTYPNSYPTRTIAIYGSQFDICSKEKIKKVVQWGDNRWNSFEKAFYENESVKTFDATDLPNLKDMTNFNSMFEGSNFTGDISDWNVSNIEQMEDMFKACHLPLDIYDKMLDKWSKLDLCMDVNFDAGNSFYSNKEARQKLIDDFNWKITDAGCKQNEEFFIATFKADEKITIEVNPDYAYNFDIDWDNDGTIDESGVNASITHTFDDEAPFRVIAIRGEFPHLVNGKNILDINQWGEIKWKSFHSSFANNENITEFSATDLPDLSMVTDLSSMFENAINFNSNIVSWDVSNITNMSKLFKKTKFSWPINNWDVSQVTDMSSMFESTSDFNSYLNDWDVSQVKNMSAMFKNSLKFNAVINNWNTTNVSDFSNMFYCARKFNKEINDWNVSSAVDMSHMFELSYKFNKNISKWNVSNVTNMEAMFCKAFVFNRDISNWDVTKVINMKSMFQNAIKFEADISSWDISQVKHMDNMFLDNEIEQETYEKMLIEWSKLNLQANVKFHAGKKTIYSDGIPKAAKEKIISTFNWTIKDGGSVVGIEENTGNLALIIYPNPSNGLVHFILPEFKSSNAKIQISNIQGQLVYQSIIDSSSKLKLSLLPGIYLSKIVDGNHTLTRKIIIE